MLGIEMEGVNSVVELDLEPHLYIIEAIVKEFIVIEDIELCWFVRGLRYPIEKSKVHALGFDSVYNYPTLSLYSAGIVKDTIAYSIALNSRYKKHLYKNVLTVDDYNNYSVANVYYDDIIDIINYHITTPGYYQKEKELKSLEKKLKLHFTLNAGPEWYKNKLLHDSYIQMLDEDSKTISNKYTDNLLLKLEEELQRLSAYIVSCNLPSDYVFTINDENRKHKVVYGEHILEKRLKEIDKL